MHLHILKGPNVMRLISTYSNLSQNSVENDMNLVDDVESYSINTQGEIRESPEKSPCSKSPDISMNDH